jgi:hypothetical protein
MGCHTRPSDPQDREGKGNHLPSPNLDALHRLAKFILGRAKAATRGLALPGHDTGGAREGKAFQASDSSCALSGSR